MSPKRVTSWKFYSIPSTPSKIKYQITNEEEEEENENENITLRMASNIQLNQQVFNISSTWCWYENQFEGFYSLDLTFSIAGKMDGGNKISFFFFCFLLLLLQILTPYCSLRSATMMEHICPINKRKARLIHAFLPFTCPTRTERIGKTSKKCDLYTFLLFRFELVSFVFQHFFSSLLFNSFCFQFLLSRSFVFPFVASYNICFLPNSAYYISLSSKAT